MFGIIADFLCSIITILFPIFASYKALRTSDPAQLTPWLMYWVVLSCILLVESWTIFVLGWIPFYSWIRVFLLSYLVLPQTQGAKLIYQDHIHPFLSRYEQNIDDLISNAHDRARSAGLLYLKQGVEFIRVSIFGLPPNQQHSPPPTSQGTYAQSLLSRFNLPSARDGLGAPASDFYGLVSSALGQAMSGGTRDLQAQEMTASGTLIPPNISSNADKMTYIATQRERLRVLMSAFDKEANNLVSPREQAMEEDVDKRMRGLNAAGMSHDDGLRKSKSELEFEPIEHEDIGVERHGNTPRDSGGSWMPWGWSGKPNTAQQPPEADRGASSGVEPRY